MSLSKTLYRLLSTGSTQEDRKAFRHDCKIVDCDVKRQNIQTNQGHCICILKYLIQLI